MEKYSCVDSMQKITITHESNSPMTLFNMPNPSVVVMCVAYVTETFDGSAPSFEVEDAADPDGFITDIGQDLGSTGFKNIEHDEWGDYFWHNAGSHSRWKFYEFDSSTQGEMTVFMCAKIC